MNIGKIHKKTPFELWRISWSWCKRKIKLFLSNGFSHVWIFWRGPFSKETPLHWRKKMRLKTEKDQYYCQFIGSLCTQDSDSTIKTNVFFWFRRYQSVAMEWDLDWGKQAFCYAEEGVWIFKWSKIKKHVFQLSDLKVPEPGNKKKDFWFRNYSAKSGISVAAMMEQSSMCYEEN